MAKNYTITKEEGIKRICEAIREAYAISDAIDKQMAEDGTEYFTETRNNVYIDTTSSFPLVIAPISYSLLHSTHTGFNCILHILSYSFSIITSISKCY